MIWAEHVARMGASKFSGRSHGKLDLKRKHVMKLWKSTEVWNIVFRLLW